jgi:hypothetical protein
LIDLLVVSANGRRWLRAYAGTPWYERRPVAVALADSVDADAAALLIHRHAGRAIRRLDAREFEPLPRQMAILLLLAVVHGVTVWLLLRMGSIRGTNLMWIGMLASPAYLYGTLAAPRSSTGICGRMIVAFYTSVVAWWVAGLVHIAMGPL